MVLGHGLCLGVRGYAGIGNQKGCVALSIVVIRDYVRVRIWAGMQGSSRDHNLVVIERLYPIIERWASGCRSKKRQRNVSNDERPLIGHAGVVILTNGNTRISLED